MKVGAFIDPIQKVLAHFKNLENYLYENIVPNKD